MGRLFDIVWKLIFLIQRLGISFHLFVVFSIFFIKVLEISAKGLSHFWWYFLLNIYPHSYFKLDCVVFVFVFVFLQRVHCSYRNVTGLCTLLLSWNFMEFVSSNRFLVDTFRLSIFKMKSSANKDKITSCTKECHCDISMHVYDIPWSHSLHPLLFLITPFLFTI
jgi:hypothetical protein